MRNEIKTNNAPAAVGPYSQAIETNDLVFISGQLPIDFQTNSIASDIKSQTTVCFENLVAICREANVSLTSAVKITVMLTDIDDFAVVNEIYAMYFEQPYPARMAYAVTSLPKGAKIAIDSIIAK